LSAAPPSRDGLAELLPATWTVVEGRVNVGSVLLSDVADRHGTPVYVVDEAHLDRRLAEFEMAFGPRVRRVYAGKAGLYGALVQLLDRAGWWIDVVSGGELEIAARSGLDPGRVILHGNAKPPDEIDAALARGVARLVVDHPGEIDLISERALATRPDGKGAEIAAGDAREVPVLVRLNADVAAVTHEKVRTTGSTAQFGMDPATAAEAARRAVAAPGVRLAGVHIHVGSQIADLDTFRRAACAIVDFVGPLRDQFGEVVDLDLGGGLAVPYVTGDPAPTVSGFAEAVLEGLAGARADERLGAHRVWIEPGRSVVATAGITVYRVVARKRLPDGHEVVALDGGLSDNPRPSMYGQRYEVLPIGAGSGAAGSEVRVVGRHCETGDLISPAARLPADLGPGGLVAVPVTGAYAYSMSSRYNGLGRPPIVWVRDGRARPVVRREGIEDLLACDLERGDSSSAVTSGWSDA